MEIVNINGNLLDSNANFILHQVNCQGAMNSGVAKAIRTKWPVVFKQYKEMCDTYEDVYELSAAALLGHIQHIRVNDSQSVINMFAQANYGYDGKRYTSYDAIYDCLNGVKSYCTTYSAKTIALPYHMSCDRGGASWEVIMAMINDIFKDTDIRIEIWKL